MRSDYGTNILIPDSAGEERLLRIHIMLDEHEFTTAMKRCCLVVKRVAEYLQEAEVRFAGGDLNDLKSQLGFTQGPDVDVRLLLNESLANFLMQKQDGITRMDRIR